MICVIAKTSPDADEKLQAIRKTVLSADSLSPLYGHITLATWLPEEDTAFTENCPELFRGVPSFPVFYEKVEVLPETSIIAALPAVSDDLAALHSRIVDSFGKSLDRWTGRDRWRPHTTLYYNLEADLYALCRDMQRCFVPFEAQICRIELSRVEKSGYTVLKSVDLL